MHDFGSFVLDGERLFFKIGYYDLTLACYSADPTDPKVTRRVLTVMLPDEY
jgi:5-formyltetrahydrofolate cyclo-ligase